MRNGISWLLWQKYMRPCFRPSNTMRINGSQTRFALFYDRSLYVGRFCPDYKMLLDRSFEIINWREIVSSYIFSFFVKNMLFLILQAFSSLIGATSKNDLFVKGNKAFLIKSYFSTQISIRFSKFMSAPSTPLNMPL